MSEMSPELQARLDEIAQALERLEGRVSLLEALRLPPPSRAVTESLRRGPSGAARGASTGTGEAWDAAQTTRILFLGGRTLVVLAGAFILRALTEKGTIPTWMGVGLGFLYAGAWMVMADRAGKAGQMLSAGFHAAAVVVIGFPLLFEGATRFKLFSPVGAAAVLTALTAAALLLSTRRGLQVLAWVVSLGGMATALALMAAAGRLAPGAIYLALLGGATLWIGYVRGWTLLRWPVAFVADLVVLIVGLQAVAQGSKEGPGPAMLVQGVLVLLYLGSFAARTLMMGRKVVLFEMIQAGAVIAVGIGGAVWVSVRSGMGQAGFGVTSVLLGIACYAVAFAFVERRQKIRENFYFYTSVALVLLLAGTALLLDEPAQSLVWGALSLLFAWLAQRQRSRTLASHAAAYAIAAALGSELLVRAVRTLFFDGSATWRPSIAAVLVLLAVAGSAWIADRIPRETVLERIPPVALDVVLALGIAGTIVAWLAPVAAGSAGALATLRTVVLVATVVATAWLGTKPGHAEAGWLAYPLLAFTGLKMLLEDLPRGSPATLVLGFACYGLALMLVPRIRSRKQPA